MAEPTLSRLPLSRGVKLGKAATIRYCLESLAYLSSPDFWFKARQQVGLSLYRRAEARAAATFYRDLHRKTNLAELVSLARAQLQKQAPGETKEGRPSPRKPRSRQIAVIIIGALLTQYLDEDISPMLQPLARLAQWNTRATSASLGLPLSPVWEDDPLQAWRTEYPEIFSETNARVRQSIETFATRTGTVIANASELYPDLTDAEVVRRIVLDLRVLEGQSARITAESASAFTYNEIRGDLYEEFGMTHRRLITMGDARVCPICLRDAAQGWLEILEPYISGSLHPPEQHPNCRCIENFERTTRFE